MFELRGTFFANLSLDNKNIKLKTLHKILVLIPLIALLAFIPARQLQEPGFEKIATDSTATIAQIEKQAFDLVNDHRKSLGLPLLINKDNIAAQARLHSRDMATGKVDFGHDGANARLDIISKSLKDMTGGAENVFYCTGNYDNLAGTAVDGWLKSHGHRVNIEGDYNFSGMGVARAANGDFYFTQIFAKGTE